MLSENAVAERGEDIWFEQQVYERGGRVMSFAIGGAAIVCAIIGAHLDNVHLRVLVSLGAMSLFGTGVLMLEPSP